MCVKTNLSNALKQEVGTEGAGQSGRKPFYGCVLLLPPARVALQQALSRLNGTEE